MFQPEIGNECTGEKLHVSLMHKWKMKEWKSAQPANEPKDQRIHESMNQ